MEYKELIKERYSVRDFENKEVVEDIIDEILEAGRIAPTACNKQPVIVYSIKNAYKTLEKVTKYVFNAENNLLICYDKNLSHKRKSDNYDFGVVDATIAATHMMLKIHDLGLGTCWVGYVFQDKLRETFNIPENIVPIAFLPFGYIKEGNEPLDLHFKRKPMSEFKREL